MSKINWIVLAAVLILASAVWGENAGYAPGEVIVEFADGVNLDNPPGLKGCDGPGLARLAEKYDVYASEPVFDLPQEPVEHPNGLWTWEDWQRMESKCRLRFFYVLKYHADADPVDVARAYSDLTEVLNAEPDYKGETYFHPNDTHFPDQWYLDYDANHECDIHAPAGWSMFLFPPPQGDFLEINGKPVVAVVDTGIWMSSPSYNNIHADIKDNVTPGRDIIDQDDYPEDTCGHGTALAGIAGARWCNNLGIAGIGKNDTLIMPIRTSHGYYDHLEMADCGGIVWALRHGADVINMSWGYGDGVIPITIVRAVEGAWELDINTVAAPGNTGGEYATYPSCDERVFMISAAGTEKVDEGWERWEGSSYFNDTIDVSAPATDIYTTWLDNGYVSGEFGTSYSAPMVAAMVAGYRHMLAHFGDPYPGIDYDALLCVWHSGADYEGSGYYYMTGFGTAYYDQGLIRAQELQPWTDGGRPKAAGLNRAPFIKTATAGPNPATTSTTFRVEAANADGADAVFTIYDLSGRKIRSLNARVTGGRAAAVWDLTSAEGRKVAPGLYIWRTDVRGVAAFKKCIVN